MRVIPIHPSADVSFDSCGDEPSGEIPKLDLPLVRRGFLKGTGVIVGMLAASSPLLALAPSRVWAVELKALSKDEGMAIMKFGRVLFPHKKLPDAVYALLAKDMDGAAAGDPKMATMLEEGVAALNKAAGGVFAKASAAKQASAVKSIEGSPFFGAVRGKCITSLYDNDMAYKVFGYPGGSWEKGGYITRGFQDLKWLPNPSESASPKPYFG
jgi:hypothetical protein